ncbi:hypothetical protein MWU54_05705 [Marivita sp. S6314]|uniref:hypothetical protein n=1 Tax=Marivita sp. S6314 TaxID=2926406 RepID=UPI001FF5A318|nr:hypothetical protein [Marivita sp. S6314]MCK0149508.1 hypothetical protein [Marivita sp. S6314]
MSKNLKSLENQADHHRTQAHSALAGLLSAFAPAKLGNQAVERAAGATDDLAQTALHHAKANPAGLALMGVGAALIALNRPKPKPQAVHGSEADRIARADAQLQAKARVRAGASPQSASKMRKMLDAGLDQLPPEARKRVMDARLQAIDAQEKVEREARKLAAQAKDAHNAQPFVTALAAAGVGALIGSLLPSTRTEGAMLGAKRDQLMRSAEAALRSEIADLEARSKAAVAAAAEEGRDAFTVDRATA